MTNQRDLVTRPSQASFSSSAIGAVEVPREMMTASENATMLAGFSKSIAGRAVEDDQITVSGKMS
jgi:hypothetical protein